MNCNDARRGERQYFSWNVRQIGWFCVAFEGRNITFDWARPCPEDEALAQERAW